MSEISPLFAVEAEELLRRGDVEGAIELCLKGRAAYPEYPAAYTILAHAYVLLGDIEAAKIELQEGANGFPRNKVIKDLSIIMADIAPGDSVPDSFKLPPPPSKPKRKAKPKPVEPPKPAPVEEEFDESTIDWSSFGLEDDKKPAEVTPTVRVLEEPVAENVATPVEEEFDESTIDWSSFGLEDDETPTEVTPTVSVIEEPVAETVATSVEEEFDESTIDWSSFGLEDDEKPAEVTPTVNKIEEKTHIIPAIVANSDEEVDLNSFDWSQFESDLEDIDEANNTIETPDAKLSENIDLANIDWDLFTKDDDNEPVESLEPLKAKPIDVPKVIIPAKTIEPKLEVEVENDEFEIDFSIFDSLPSSDDESNDLNNEESPEFQALKQQIALLSKELEVEPDQAKEKPAKIEADCLDVVLADGDPENLISNDRKVDELSDFIFENISSSDNDEDIINSYDNNSRDNEAADSDEDFDMQMFSDVLQEEPSPTPTSSTSIETIKFSVDSTKSIKDFSSKKLGFVARTVDPTDIAIIPGLEDLSASGYEPKSLSKNLGAKQGLDLIKLASGLDNAKILPPDEKEDIIDEDIIPTFTGAATETMARILTGQCKYDEAIGIYQRLIEKTPEKSVYYGEQIERLNALKAENL